VEVCLFAFYSRRGFFERLAASDEAKDSQKRGHLKSNGGLGEAPKGHQSMVFTRIRAHAQICMKIDDEPYLEEALHGAR
jgi:hypothetical protein